MKRRITIFDHQQWRESISPAPAEERDDIDIHLVENPPTQRPKREVASLLRLLDELDQEDNTP